MWIGWFFRPKIQERIGTWLKKMIAFSKTVFVIAFLLFNGIETTFFGFHNFFDNDTKVKDYKVYWNVPTFMCHQYGLYFEEVSRQFGIIQNPRDEFRGDEIVMLYDPGMFPALLKSANGSLVIRNGGVPQMGNVSAHLELFRDHLNEQIANESFRGLGVIDFESWRPIYRQNWASLAPYRDLSLKIARQRHPSWDKKSHEREAVKDFETWGRIFMQETLRVAVTLRPQATWGYYAYPYCFNLTPRQSNSQCDPKVLDDNNRISWLFRAQNVLLPSIYLRMNLTDNQKIGLINGRIREALRISRRYNPTAEVLPYFWYKYQDQRDIFLSREDIVHGFHEIVDQGADGYVIWGSSNDLNTRDKCQKFRVYLNDILGPAVVESKEMAKQRKGRAIGKDIEEVIHESNSPTEIHPIAISIA